MADLELQVSSSSRKQKRDDIEAVDLTQELQPSKKQKCSDECVDTASVDAVLVAAMILFDMSRSKHPLEKEKLQENGNLIKSVASQPAMNKHQPNRKNNKRSHECMICGANYPTGQALGGHKRLHYIMPNPACDPNVKPATERSTRRRVVKPARLIELID